MPLRLLDRRHVDDPRALRLAEHLLQRGVLLRLVDGGLHLQEQVGPDELAHPGERVAHPQLVDDVVAHLRRGRGRERHHRRPPQPLRDAAQHHVVGAEVVAPLAHAVRLVYHEQRHLAVQQHLEELAVAKALRRDVQDLAAAALHRLLRRALLPRRLGGVDGPRVHAQLVELVRLVLHQRDEGRHDDGEPRQQQRRQLVDERLAGPRGQHHERVLAGQHGADGLLLSRPELVQREVLFQERKQVRVRVGLRRSGGQLISLAAELGLDLQPQGKL